jgi:phosphoglycerate dehydrogenase-like enzyme
MRAAILDDYQNCALSMAEWTRIAADVDVTVFNRPFAGTDDAARALRPFEIVCAMRERTAFGRDLFSQLPNLKLLVTTGLRNAAIDLNAARDLGVMVCGTQVMGHATAELTWTLILGLARHLPIEAANMRSGGWQTTLGYDLRGKTLGVIGLGRLGAQVAKIGLAFGMEVVAWSQNLTADRAREVGVPAVSKDELFAGSDVVTIHLVLSGRTRGLVAEPEFAQMKPTAFLINTSRGPIVDTAALISALNQGRIAGAGIDVYDYEPLAPDHPLRSCPNALLTPHIGYVTEETYRVFYDQTVDAIAAYLAGEPIRVLT